jgi:Fe-S oxidoreductase
MAKLKAEFMQHYYDANGVPFRSKLIANFTNSSKLGAIAPSLYNFVMTNSAVSSLVKKASGFATKRSMPTMYKTTLEKWFKAEGRRQKVEGKRWKEESPSNTASSSLHHNPPTVYLFCDEFTNYNDTQIGIKAVELLNKLGYEVVIPEHIESGRSWLSKGLIRKGKEIANKNIELLHPLISADTPLIGIEPSAILTFRDEYIDLATDDNFEKAKQLAANALMIDEFIAREIDKGNISKNQFTVANKKIKLHGHCQQKALVGTAATVKVLSFPENYSVETIPSGCCGMAGSFGYEKEHYDLSMKIGEMVLFPAVRNAADDVIIAAPGTSCRHQVKDGTGKKALHPVEVLWEALK